MTGKVLLETRGLCKQFGGLAAVSNVDVTIFEGEILGLIGPNGAGKTTFINAITGLDPATSGQVLFENRDITRLPPHRVNQLGIARTFQVVKPFSHLRVRENVAVGAMFGAGGRSRSGSEAFHRADELLELVGLDRKRDDYADELTVADLKRLELARALALDPRLLLLDEVMAGLNPKEIEVAMDLIRDVHDHGVTILVIEHVMKAIMGLSERIVVLHYGEKIAEGQPDEIAASPEVIKAYLGEKYARRAGTGANDADN
jgi:branched-chain amino acid transport system ATP-binding protein